MPTYPLRWVASSDATWEDRWARRHGDARSANPDMERLVAAANLDLAENGYSAIQLRGGAVSIDATSGDFARVLDVVRRHGFEFDPGPRQDRATNAEAMSNRPGATLIDFVENFYGMRVDDIIATADSLYKADHADEARWMAEMRAMAEADMEEQRRLRPGTNSFVDAPKSPDQYPTPPHYGHSLVGFLRAEEFLELHGLQWLPNVDAPPELPLGEVRPFFSRSRPSSLDSPDYQQGFSLNPATTGGDLLNTAVPDADTKEVKALLLYAHSVVVSDPFVERDANEWDGRRFRDELWIPGMLGGYLQRHRATTPLSGRPNDFMDALRLVAELAPLARTGVVLLLPPARHDAVNYGDQQDLLSRIADGLFFAGFVRDPSSRNRDTEQISMILAQRAIDQVRALIAFGSTGSNFLAGEFDAIALSALLDEMISCGSIDAALVHRDAEDRRLTKLSELVLPGVDGLRARDINRIREADEFGNFRADVRNGLRDLTGDASDSVEFREAMRSAAERLGLASRRNLAWDQARDGVVAWGLGALAGWSVEDWRSSLLGQTVGLTAYATIRTFGSKSRAVRNHYVAVQ